MGVGSITFSLPHFLSGNYMVSSSSNSTENNICARAGSTRVNGAAGGFSSSGSGRSRTGLRTAKDEDILNQLPGLDKIKSLTEGKLECLGTCALHVVTLPIWRKQMELLTFVHNMSTCMFFFIT